MKVPAAIITFSQSEKVKSGIIWLTQTLELLTGLSLAEKHGAERIIRALADMISHEIRLAKNLTKEALWDEVAKHLDMAQVMINSQMAPEAGFHLTQALTQVTSMAQRSMTVLKDEGLL
jgi:hypothetical protein